MNKKPTATSMKPAKSFRSIAVALATALCVPSLVSAQSGPPDKMAYQGFLVDGAGAPIGATPVNREVIFRIYDQSDAGTLLWAETQIVTVNRGYFSVFLGEGSANGGEPRPSLSGLFSGGGSSERYVETTLKSLTGAPETPITPRMRLLSAPYAYSADHAKTADSATTATSAGRLNSGYEYLRKRADNQIDYIAGNKTKHNFYNGAIRMWANANMADITVNGQSRYFMISLDPEGTGEWNHVVQKSVGPSYAICYGTTEKVYMTPGGNGWVTPSDRSLKKNFEYQSEGWLDRLEAINPVWYNMKDDPEGSPKQFGVIAQDVEKALPAAVSKNGDILGVSYPSLGVAAIGGVKELKKRTDKEISALKEENQQLKDTLGQLMQRLQALENQVQ